MIQIRVDSLSNKRKSEDTNVTLPSNERLKNTAIFNELGLINSLQKTKLETKLFLGVLENEKRVYFNVKFTRSDILCTTSVDFANLLKNLDSFNFDQTGGRAKSFKGQFPTRRKGNSNFSKITIAYLMAFKFICDYKTVGYVNEFPSKELVLDLMSLVMPEVEGRNEDSSFYGVTPRNLVKAWNFPLIKDYDLYKKYFNSLVQMELKDIKNSTNQDLHKYIAS